MLFMTCHKHWSCNTILTYETPHAQQPQRPLHCRTDCWKAGYMETNIYYIKSFTILQKRFICTMQQVPCEPVSKWSK